MACNKLSVNEFVKQYILDHESRSRKYCFILGAGASKQSGIPTGGELAKKWLKEIHDKYDSSTIEKWKDEIGFAANQEAEKYSDIYSKRFEITPKEGYLFLEDIMETIEPSFGYSVLAQILEKTEDNIVITTNFDSLVEDAMFIYTKKKPLTLGHESLAGFINLFSNRPIIAKIHRDLLLSPKNKQDEISALEDSWEDSLATIFKYYTPIVIGYGGNDGSLMKFLEKRADKSIGMFWFYWDNDDQNHLPSEGIINLVEKYKGYIIPIKGFDELMLQLNNAMKFDLIGEELIDIAKNRTKKYHEKITTLNASSSLSVKAMISDAVKNQRKDWWTLQIDIDNEQNIDKKKAMYLTALEEYPNSVELITNYADFLSSEMMDYDGADKYYLEAIDKDPKNIYSLGAYGYFLLDSLDNPQKASIYFNTASKIDPNSPLVYNSYGLLEEYNKNFEAALSHYLKVIELEPTDWVGYSNSANCYSRLGKLELAEHYFKKAIEMNPSGREVLSNYGYFLLRQMKYYEAEIIFKKGLSLNLKEANLYGNYSKLKIECDDFESARELIDKSFKLNNRLKNDLIIELWFYRYAIFDDWFTEAEEQIEYLLNENVRSIDWNFDIIVEKAKKLNHRNLQKLIEYQKRIIAE